MYKQGLHDVGWLNNPKYSMWKKKSLHSSKWAWKNVNNGQLESLKECLKTQSRAVGAVSPYKQQKITHMSLITCETARIYLVQNKEAPRKLRQEQALIQSEVILHLGKSSTQNIRLHSPNKS